MEVLEKPKYLSIQKIKKYISTLKRAMFLAIYPKHCPLCHKILPLTTSICPTCEKKLPFIQEPVCYRCGKPVSSAEQEFCYDCRSFSKSFQKGYALLLYNEITKPIMADLKYHNKRILSKFLAEQILAHHREILLNTNFQYIIPVPIHKQKKKSRGYNQAELLAKELSAGLNIPVLPDLLIRTIDTLPQKYFSAQSRHKNLLCAFAFNDNYDLSSIDSVLLIDDIYTTGATMEACTKVLMSSGVKKVFIYSVCIGLSRD